MFYLKCNSVKGSSVYIAYSIKSSMAPCDHRMKLKFLHTARKALRTGSHLLQTHSSLLPTPLPAAPHLLLPLPSRSCTVHFLPNFTSLNKPEYHPQTLSILTPRSSGPQARCPPISLPLYPSQCVKCRLPYVPTVGSRLNVIRLCLLST